MNGSLAPRLGSQGPGHIFSLARPWPCLHWAGHSPPSPPKQHTRYTEGSWAGLKMVGSGGGGGLGNPDRQAIIKLAFLGRVLTEDGDKSLIIPFQRIDNIG